MNEPARALLRDLLSYQPADAMETQAYTTIVRFLESETQPFSRQTLQRHITASAFLVDETYERLLFVWHRKLQKWLQPGGHIETADASVYDAAAREALEETGHDTRASIISNAIFDVDVHAIPARADDPAHEHLDIRYLMVVGEKVGRADHELRWLRVADVDGTETDAATVRAVRKLHRLLERR